MTLLYLHWELLLTLGMPNKTTVIQAQNFVSYMEFCMENFSFYIGKFLLHLLLAWDHIYLFCHLDYDAIMHCFAPGCSLINW